MFEWVLLILGFVMVLLVLWEVFQDLFHPAASGALSDWIGRKLFTALRRWPRAMPMAGPLLVVLVISTWLVLLVLGFAFIFYGGFPAQFSTSTGQTPTEPARFAAVVYFSYETLITLGFGDLVVRTVFFRFVASTEALIGLGLLTASVSMLMLIYPALARQRVLARTISNMVDAENLTGEDVVTAGSHVLLAGLARDLTRLRVDLIHSPMVYYFVTSDERSMVPHWMAQLRRWASDGLSPGAEPRVRLAAGALDGALSDFAQLLSRRFIREEVQDPVKVFEAYARDHRVRLAEPR